ncbi:hypothetical protein [Pseudonocardia pini]|uniref:hypothetical protein n=1 Tax=Pseudonocardia pini TaxID=2758030 RepID=UPI0015F0E509|nr:hypothetical protein [Pseudonocardia pini]
MHWFFTVLLIAASAGTVAFTGALLRRLFTTAPDAAAALAVAPTEDPPEEPSA